MSTRRSRRPLKGIVGTTPADLEECAMRSVQRRYRKQRRNVQAAKDPRECLREARANFGHQQLRKLGEFLEMRAKARRRHARRHPRMADGTRASRREARRVRRKTV
jgi:hypothetical protein